MTTATALNSSDASLAQEFERLFREHGAMVYRTAYGVTGSREDAQDILQTVFLKLMRRDPARDVQQNPKGYLYRAAVNLSLDTLKARRRRPFFSDIDHTPVAAPIVELMDEDHSRLYMAVASLSAQTKQRCNVSMKREVRNHSAESACPRPPEHENPIWWRNDDSTGPKAFT